NVAANAGFAAANIDHVWIGFGDGDRAYGADLCFVRDILPSQSAVGGLPHTAGHGAEIIGVQLTDNSRDSQRASAAKWPDQAPVEPLECGIIFRSLCAVSLRLRAVFFLLSLRRGFFRFRFRFRSLVCEGERR